MTIALKCYLTGPRDSSAEKGYASKTASRFESRYAPTSGVLACVRACVRARFRKYVRATERERRACTGRYYRGAGTIIVAAAASFATISTTAHKAGNRLMVAKTSKKKTPTWPGRFWIFFSVFETHARPPRASAHVLLRPPNGRLAVSQYAVTPATKIRCRRVFAPPQRTVERLQAPWRVHGVGRLCPICSFDLLRGFFRS